MSLLSPLDLFKEWPESECIGFALTNRPYDRLEGVSFPLLSCEKAAESHQLWDREGTLSRQCICWLLDLLLSSF